SQRAVAVSPIPAPLRPAVTGARYRTIRHDGDGQTDDFREKCFKDVVSTSAQNATLVPSNARLPDQRDQAIRARQVGVEAALDSWDRFGLGQTLYRWSGTDRLSIMPRPRLLPRWTPTARR